MKKAALGVSIFILTLLLSFPLFFPTESLVRYYLWKLDENSGINVSFERGVFSFNKAEIFGVELYDKGKHLTSFKEISGVIWPSAQKVKVLKGDGEAKIDVNSTEINFNLNNFQMVSDGRKFFREVFMTGDFKYVKGERKGKGKISARLLGSKDPFLKSDIAANFDIESSPRDININVSQIEGENITGDGRIFVSINEKKFGSSMITGTLRLNIGKDPIRIRISGTIDEPSAVPVMTGIR
jgi:hypothetical protein